MATYSPAGVPIPDPKPTTPAPEAPDGDLRTQWNTFLSDPANRAGLLQFGLSMLSSAGPGGGTVAQNFGDAAQAGMAVRGETIAAQTASDMASRKEAREEAKTAADVTLKGAQAQRALRGPQYSPTASGMVTARDYAKARVKYISDARAAGDDRPNADLINEFNQIWNANTAAPPTVAPAAAGAANTAINSMTLEQLQALDVNTMTPADASLALARYKALKGTK